MRERTPNTPVHDQPEAALDIIIQVITEHLQAHSFSCGTSPHLPRFMFVRKIHDPNKAGHFRHLSQQPVGTVAVTERIVGVCCHGTGLDIEIPLSDPDMLNKLVRILGASAEQR